MTAKLVGLVVGLILSMGAGAVANDVGAVIDLAAQYRRDGNLRLSIEVLEAARAKLGPACPARLNGELGATYFQAHRLGDAGKELDIAYAKATDPAERAVVANDLGNLAASLGRRDDAARYYREAQALAGADASVAVSAGRNLARLAPPDQRLAELRSLSGQVAGIPDPQNKIETLVVVDCKGRM